MNTMRRAVLAAISLILLLLLLAIYNIAHILTPLSSLLFDRYTYTLIPASAIPDPSASVRPQSTNQAQLIPKILHQTYKNESIPSAWLLAQESCRALHPDWEFKFWTDASARAFVEDQYAWFLPTFDGYRFPVQRADALRYFLLAHFGGVYLDLDDGCQRPLEPLLAFESWVHDTAPTGISNDAMGASKGHPFFLRVIHRLKAYDRNYVFPYLTVMASTGPLFLSLVLEEWIRLNAGHHGGKGASASQVGEGTESWGGQVRVLSQAHSFGNDWSFWFHAGGGSKGGSSWHSWDAKAVGWIATHRNFVIFVGALVLLLGGLTCWWVYGWWKQIRGWRRGRSWPWKGDGGHKYELVTIGEHDA